MDTHRETRQMNTPRASVSLFILGDFLVNGQSMSEAYPK